MVCLHTLEETISLEMNEGCDWRQDEVGTVRHSSEGKGAKMNSALAAGEQKDRNVQNTW